MTQKELARKAMNRASKRLIPFLFLMYILAFLDRANVGFAKEYLAADAGISAAAFALGAGIFFIGYAVFEVPSNLIMHKVGARRWLSRIMITWGMVAAGFAFVPNDTVFLILRVLLGIAEAGFFPGVIYFLCFWFTKERRTSVIALFFAAVPAALVVGGPLSGFLLEKTHDFLGLAGWKWMFLIEGFMPVVVGVIALFYLTDRPSEAHWIPEDERRALQNELEAELREGGMVQHGGILKALTHPMVLFLVALNFMLNISLYGVTFHLPTHVGHLLGSAVNFKVGLISAIPWFVGVAVVIYTGRMADKNGFNAAIGAVVIAMSGVGLIISQSMDPVWGIFGLCLAASGALAGFPMFWAMPPRFLNGAALAGAVGLINCLGNLGGFVAPNLREYITKVSGGQNDALVAIGLAGVLAALLFLVTIKMGIGHRKLTQKSEVPGAEKAHYEAA